MKPNILMIVTDQLRADCVGCYHGYPVKTPNIDQLAREGMVFEQAYTPLPVCCPARQSMISSCRPERHGGLWNYGLLNIGGLDPKPEHWPLQLKAQGYHSAYLGKWHVSPDFSPLDFGYEYHLDYDDYDVYRAEHGYSSVWDIWETWEGNVDPTPVELSHTHWLAHVACEQIKYHKNVEGPWHIRIDFDEPHLPCQPCQEFLDMYNEAETPEWAGFRDEFVDKPYIQKQQLLNWGMENYTWEEWRKIVTRYYAVISQVDDAIGRVIRTLKEEGQWENTLIIFTADHGDMCGSHRMMDKHYVLYDDIVHVPLIAVWPGHIAPGVRSDAFVYQALDLGPTLMDITGGNLPFTDGCSLVPLLKSEKPSEWRQNVISTYNGQQFGLYTQRMLRNREWKYVWNTTDVDELYDLINDPGELCNLIHVPQYQEKVKEMRRELYKGLKENGDSLIDSEWMERQLLYDKKL